jgi:ribosomal subunit interface protein
MQLDIQCQGFDLTEGIRAHTRRRLAFALGRSALHLSRVAVLLADINGPRGGRDKRCRIRVRLHPAIEVVVEDTESDLYTAIDRAAERVGRAVVRQIRRQRQTSLILARAQLDAGYVGGLPS